MGGTSSLVQIKFLEIRIRIPRPQCANVLTDPSILFLFNFSANLKELNCVSSYTGSKKGNTCPFLRFYTFIKEYQVFQVYHHVSRFSRSSENPKENEAFQEINSTHPERNGLHLCIATSKHNPGDCTPRSSGE